MVMTDRVDVGITMFIETQTTGDDEMASTFQQLTKLTAKHEVILVAMHSGRKSTYDMFDFPGSGAAVFDELAQKFGVICGTHRLGFSMSKRGANWAAKRA